jgi:hypothetical protein
MSRYCYQVPGEQLLVVQASTAAELERQAAVALAAVPAGNVVTALELAGSGKGARFTLQIQHGVGDGLDPTRLELRCYVAETPAAVARARAAAAGRAPAGYALYDTVLAGAADGLPVCGVLAYLDPDGGFLNGWWLVGDWYIDAVGGDDANSGRAAEQALATAAELRRRLGPNPVLSQPVRVHILSDLSEDIYLEATFSGDRGVLVLLADGPKAILATDTISAWTAFTINTEGELTGTAITDFTPYIGQRLVITDGANAGWSYFIQGIGSSAAATEVARVGAGSRQNPATPWPYYPPAMEVSDNNVGAPGDHFRIEQLYQVGNLHLVAHRLNSGTDGQGGVATFVVDGLFVAGTADGFHSFYCNDNPSGGQQMFDPILWQCLLAGTVHGNVLQIKGSACMAYLQLSNLAVHGLGGVLWCSGVRLHYARWLCVEQVRLADQSVATYPIQAGVWDTGPSGPGVYVDPTSVGVFGEVWGSLVNINPRYAFQIDGRAYYVDADDLTLAPSVAGLEVCLGGDHTWLYANLPKQNDLVGGVDTNDAMFAPIPATCTPPA